MQNNQGLSTSNTNVEAKAVTQEKIQIKAIRNDSSPDRATQRGG